MRVVAAIALTAVLSISAAYADPASILVRGGSAAPDVRNEHVRLVSETLTIDLCGLETAVTADLLFRNEGPDHTCMMGFPQVNHKSAAKLTAESGRPTDLRDLALF